MPKHGELFYMNKISQLDVSDEKIMEENGPVFYGKNIKFIEKP
jgi:hypothetical protein